MAQRRKGMGQGIEDISHFFISMRESSGSAAAADQAVQEAPAGGPIHRRVAVIARTPGIPGFAWSARLALALSHCGTKVVLMDIGSDAESLSGILPSNSVFPSLGVLLDQADKSIAKDSPAGFRVLSFQFRSEEFRGFGPEEREILFQMLCREERQSEILLSHVQFDLLNPEALRHLRFFDEAILIVPRENARETYGALKVLYHLDPKMRVGMIDAGDSREPGPTPAERLAAAARQFLGKSPAILGRIPGSSSETGDRAMKWPGEAAGRENFREELTALGRSILSGLNGPKDGLLFFEKINSKPNGFV